MDLPRALPDHLSALTQALDDPGTDLPTILDVLVDDLTAAVPSFLGLVMTLHQDGVAVTLATSDANPADGAGASLALPLAPLISTDPASTAVFYARNPGAFVDLAADTRRLYGLDGQVVVDGHLPRTSDPPSTTRSPEATDPPHAAGQRAGTDPPAVTAAPSRAGVTGLDDLSDVNQAIGVLLTRGYTPVEGHAELRRRADLADQSLAEAAQHLLRTVNWRPPRPPDAGA